MLLTIDRNGKEPIYLQIISQIKRLIDLGDLAEGFQMPSTRQLSASLGVNRSTIVKVYEELWSAGYLESTAGSYTKVRSPRKRSLPKTTEAEADDFWSTAVTKNYYHSDDILIVPAKSENRETINLRGLEADPALIDKKLLCEAFHKSVYSKETNVFGYCHPQGMHPLREVLATHMHLHCIDASADNILITNGSQNSLMLLFHTFISSGDTIAIERPTYTLLIQLAKHFKCRVVEIPMQNDGMDLDFLQSCMDKMKIKMVITTPTFQNPTGITMSPKKREQLLSLCEDNDAILVEDSIEEELKYFGMAHLPIKSKDTRGRVIYLGSFSKILSPGLRLGWIIADKKCIFRLASVKRLFDISTNTYSQALALNYCKSGYYELHLRRCMRVYRKRMRCALKALRSYLPQEKAEWIEPLGGFTIWVKLKADIGDLSAIDRLAASGVSVADGSNFFYSPTRENYFRLSICNCSEDEIEEGVKRISKILL